MVDYQTFGINILIPSIVLGLIVGALLMRNLGLNVWRDAILLVILLIIVASCTQSLPKPNQRNSCTQIKIVKVCNDR